MTKSKAYSIRQILQLMGNDPDCDDIEILELKKELENKTVLELLTMIKELKDNPVPTFFSRVGGFT